jgi:hypothetical protein
MNACLPKHRLLGPSLGNIIVKVPKIVSDKAQENRKAILTMPPPEAASHQLWPKTPPQKRN